MPPRSLSDVKPEERPHKSSWPTQQDMSPNTVDRRTRAKISSREMNYVDEEKNNKSKSENRKKKKILPKEEISQSWVMTLQWKVIPMKTSLEQMRRYVLPTLRFGVCGLTRFSGEKSYRNWFRQSTLITSMINFLRRCNFENSFQRREIHLLRR